MKSRIGKAIYGMTLMSVLSLAGAPILTPTWIVAAQNQEFHAKKQNLEPQVEGTWRVIVTIRVCQTNAEIRTFPSLVTFAQGGTMTETTTAASPTLRGPGHGVWERTGEHTFNQVFEAFTFNQSGAWTGTQTVRHAVELREDGEKLSSSGSSEIFDANGTLLLMGCSTAVGYRLK